MTLAPQTTDVTEPQAANKLLAVDVIVPCHNYAHYLETCVRSVLAQTGVTLRVLVIDDASPDHTREVCRALAATDARVSWLRNVSNLGHIATYNLGLAWVRAPLHLLLSADDWLLPDALTRASALMQAYPQVGLCFGRSLEHHTDGSLRPALLAVDGLRPGGQRVMSGADFMELVRRSGTTNIVPTPTAVVRTELQQRLGGYRPDLPHSGDLELWLRLAAHGDVACLDSAQAVYRLHGRNMSSGYCSDLKLADLRQRRAAVCWLCHAQEDVLAEPQQLLQDLLRPLALEAADLAETARRQGRADLTRALTEFVQDIDPRLSNAPRWWRHLCRRLERRHLARHLGRHANSRPVQISTSLLRRAAARLLT
ncbi:MAG: hypothetical protein RIQ60_2155 [Pseudomonadota bacterium]|jgi:GT2 family glycosyltransferase